MNTTNNPKTNAQDDALVAKVRNALENYPPFHVFDDAVCIDAHDGVVSLHGIVRSQSASETAVELARRVPGVSAVENRLDVDADIELAVAQALGADPRTQAGFPGILIGVVFGVVYLKGPVPTAEVKKAAGEIAASVPKVRSVDNQLQPAK